MLDGASAPDKYDLIEGGRFKMIACEVGRATGLATFVGPSWLACPQKSPVMPRFPKVNTSPAWQLKNRLQSL